MSAIYTDRAEDTLGGTLNLRAWTAREWTIRHHVAGMEFVGVDKSARCGKGGHRRSGQCGSGQCRSGQMPVKNVLKTS